MATLQDEIDAYMKNFSRTNLAKNPSKYIPADINLLSTDKNVSGYVQPGVSTNTMYLNPKNLRDQLGWLSTYAHEAAHIDQSKRNPYAFNLSNMFGAKLGMPFWQLDRVAYDEYNGDKYPPPAEIAADMRMHEAMAPNGTRWNKTYQGEEILEQVKNKYQYGRQRAGYTEAQLKSQIERLLFPQNHEVAPGHRQGKK